MRSGSSTIRCCAVIFSLWLCAVATPCATDPTPATIRLNPGGESAPIPPRFLGLSFEAADLGHPRLIRTRDDLVGLLRLLGPGVLRFGGSSVERTRWQNFASTAEGAVGPNEWQAVLEIARAADWKLIVGINPEIAQPAGALDQAEHVWRDAKQIMALEIGNEPDLFGPRADLFGERPWSYERFRFEYDRLHAQLIARNPDLRIVGPSTCCRPSWFERFVATAPSNLIATTHHLYPLGAAQSPQLRQRPTLDNLLAQRTQRDTAERAKQLVDVAERYGFTVRINETNSSIHGGQPGVGDVFAAALWGADHLFTLAEAGVSGVDFHVGGLACAPYSPICLRGNEPVVRPLAYGMLLFRLAAVGRMIPVRLRGDEQLTVYATQARDQSLRVVLINKRATDRTARLSIRRGRNYHAAKVIRLHAPAIDRRDGITLGGQPIDPTTQWQPEAEERVQREGRRFVFAVPAYSALLATFERVDR